MTSNQQNLSSRNAFARFMLGTVMTAYGTLHLIRDPKNRRGQMLILLGAMKTAEGATKFCPAKAMGISMSCSNMLQKMMSGNNPQNSSNTGAAMNTGAQTSQNFPGGSTGQMGESVMQKVGNLAQKLAGENTSQNTAGSKQNTNNSARQNTTGSNTDQTVGTNNGENLATTPSGASNKNANTKNTTNSEYKKSTSATNNSGNK